MFVLLILHSTANRKKAVESLIRNKIKNGHFTEEMLGAAFNSQSQVSLYEYCRRGTVLIGDGVIELGLVFWDNAWTV